MKGQFEHLTWYHLTNHVTAEEIANALPKILSEEALYALAWKIDAHLGTGVFQKRVVRDFQSRVFRYNKYDGW